MSANCMAKDVGSSRSLVDMAPSYLKVGHAKGHNKGPMLDSRSAAAFWYPPYSGKSRNFCHHHHHHSPQLATTSSSLQ